MCPDRYQTQGGHLIVNSGQRNGSRANFNIMSSHILTPQAPKIHPVYIRLLCDVLRKRGLDVTALLDAAGLRPESIGEDAASVHFSQLLTLIRLARHQCDDSLLPIEWGRRIRANVHGSVGTAIFASGIVRQALRAAEILAMLRCSAMCLSLQEEGDWARLDCKPVVPLYGQEDFIATAMTLGVLEILRSLLGRHISRVCIEFPFAPPDWAEERKAHCASEAIFGSPKLTFRFPIELLDRALPSADVHDHEAAMRQCQLDLRQTSARLSERLAAYLASHTETYPNLDQVAGNFCMSPRTLRRTLQREGTSYQKVFNSVRIESATVLLKESTLSIEAISLRVGYQEPSNFIRAFRKAHGCTPRQFRNGR